MSRSQLCCMSGLFQFCPWWELSGDTHLLPCPVSSLLHLFLLVLTSLPFSAHDSVPSCVADSDLFPSNLAVVASFSLLPICLHPIIMLPSALLEELCQKSPLCAVCLPGLSRKILFPAISLAAVRKVSPAEGRHFSELHPSLSCLRGDRVC